MRDDRAGAGVNHQFIFFLKGKAAREAEMSGGNIDRNGICKLLHVVFDSAGEMRSDIVKIIIAGAVFDAGVVVLQRHVVVLVEQLCRFIVRQAVRIRTCRALAIVGSQTRILDHRVEQADEMRNHVRNLVDMHWRSLPDHRGRAWGCAWHTSQRRCFVLRKPGPSTANCTGGCRCSSFRQEVGIRSDPHRRQKHASYRL
ncbi:hypothetical protein D3C86_1272520 [compost metagenome]